MLDQDPKPFGAGPSRSWELRLPRGRRLTLGPRPAIVGILNCTPDSFSDGGRFARPQEAVDAGVRMLASGADWLDLGGESTRPGAQPVPPALQLERLLPVLSALRARTEAPLSVDTMSSAVGARVLEEGADIINDVSALRDPEWLPLLRERDVPVVLAHMKGSPLDMQLDPVYPRGATVEVLEFFRDRIERLGREGISSERLIVDPGIGFGKRVKDNLELIRNIGTLRTLGRPIFIGTSRKSFLRKILGEESPDLDVATVIVNSVALLSGASVLRVHDVARTASLVKIFLEFRDSAEAAPDAAAARASGSRAPPGEGR